ncbi:hypothetical protein [Sorangium sp. So ce590]|uniref:hypothetical protein n=1 Tax=unclassified Sorangium TaxID=2621164 RepID=UPI003F5E8F01
MPSGRGLALIALLAGAPALVAGCAGATGEAPRTPRPGVHVALMPTAWATEASVEGVDGDSAMASALARRGGARVSRLSARLSRSPGCADDAACVREAARALGASKIVRTELAGLGATVLVRGTIVDVETQMREQLMQEVVHDADPARLRAAIERLGERLAKPWAPLPPGPRHAWYEEPWLWVGVAAAATAGAAAGIGVALSSGEGDPDVVLTPP